MQSLGRSGAVGLPYRTPGTPRSRGRRLRPRYGGGADQGDENNEATHGAHMYITMRLAASLILLLALAWPSHAQSARPAPPRPRTYTYLIEEGVSIDGYKPGDWELATWALQAWERNAAATLRSTGTQRLATNPHQMGLAARGAVRRNPLDTRPPDGHGLHPA